MQLDSEVQRLQHEVELLRLKDLQQEHHIHMLTQQLRSSQPQPHQADTQVLAALLPSHPAYLAVPNSIKPKQLSHSQACQNSITVRYACAVAPCYTLSSIAFPAMPSQRHDLHTDKG